MPWFVERADVKHDEAMLTRKPVRPAMPSRIAEDHRTVA
jgi:hypothetical protein